MSAPLVEFDLPPHYALEPHKSLLRAINAIKDKGLLGKVISSNYASYNSFIAKSDFLSDYIQLVRFFMTLVRDPYSMAVKVKRGLILPQESDFTRFRITQGVISDTITIEAPDLLIDYRDEIRHQAPLLLAAAESVFDQAVFYIYNFGVSSMEEIRLLETRLGPEGRAEFISAKGIIGLWNAISGDPGFGEISKNSYTIRFKPNNLVDLGGIEGDAIEVTDARYDPWTHFIWYKSFIIAEIKSRYYDKLEVVYYHGLSPQKTIIRIDPTKLYFKK